MNKFYFLFTLISLSFVKSQNDSPVNFISFTNRRMSYSEAYDFCHSRNATLASILSEDELNLAAVAFGRRPLVTKYWVSASDLFSEGEFYWSVGNHTLGLVSSGGQEIFPNEIRPEILNNCVKYIVATRKFTTTSCTLERAVPICERRRYSAPSAVNNNENLVETSLQNLGRDFLCNIGYDTITTINDELYVFRGRLVWKLADKGVQDPENYPVLLTDLFPFPNNDAPLKIDVALHDMDGHIALFSGSQYWVYDTSFNFLVGPTPITNITLPSTLTKIDAAFIRERTRNIFVFSGNQYWRYDETFTLDEGYPQDVSNWWPYLNPNTPNSIDFIVNWENATYFFKKDYYMQYNNPPQEINEPLPIAKNWLGC